MAILIKVSYGELLDRISILEIKSERIADTAKLKNIRHELALLTNTWHAATLEKNHPQLTALRHKLKEINSSLWTVEDILREHERDKKFDAGFIQCARDVYFTNDRRAAVKREIDTLLGSALLEEKSYQPY